MEKFMHTTIPTTESLVQNVRARVHRNSASLLRFIKSIPKNMTWGRAFTLLWLGTYAGLAAAQVSDSSAPWDSSLCGIAGWFRGPTMIAIGSVAFGAAGAGFVFGEELTGIMKKVLNITMAVAMAIGGASIIGWIAVKAGAARSSCGV
jgi:type IV secretion system protein VirB2